MTDFDSPWKEALERYFPKFLAFFFPAAHADIDWKRGYEFLDKELQQITRDAELGRRLVDKLARVWGHDGEEDLVLIHIEIQGQSEAEFAERMFVYNYRLYDRYRRAVVSLAVLGDSTPAWRPSTFGYQRWGCEVGIRFPMVKLLDYREQWEMLDQAVNPFAVVVMAHLEAQATAKDEQARYQAKQRLIRSLYRRGYERQAILELFRFIDWVLELPEALEEQLWQELQQYEETQRMPYITSVERIGFKKGVEQGRQEGLQQGEVQVLRRQLTRRFGPLPEWAEERLTKADLAQLEVWADRVLDAETLDAVFQ
jgi:hypothetical protein